MSNVRPSQAAFISHRSRNLLKSGLLNLHSTKHYQPNPFSIEDSDDVISLPVNYNDDFERIPDRYVTWI